MAILGSGDIQVTNDILFSIHLFWKDRLFFVHHFCHGDVHPH